MAARATDGVELTSFGSPVNLLKLPENADGRDIELLEVLTVGAAGTHTITVKTKGSGGATRTYNVTAGSELKMQIRSIESVSDVTAVRVSWGEF